MNDYPSNLEIVNEFRTFLDERAVDGVVLAKLVDDITVDGDTVTITYATEHEGAHLATVISLTADNDVLHLPGTVVAFDNDEGRLVRSVIKNLRARTTDGTELGHKTTAEIYRAGTGKELD